MKIKLLSLLLLLALISSFTACEKNTADTETGTSAESTSITEEYAEPLATLSLNGSTEYKLVSSKSVRSDVIDVLLDFYLNLLQATGVNFARSDDSVYEGVDYGAKCEIIFGAANREECREVYNSIGYDGYAVKLSGNKIVLAAYSAQGLSLAANAFFNECIRIENDGDSINAYYIRDYVYEGERGLFFTDENPLSSYKVVYSTASATLASRFVMEIEKACGVALPLVKDTEPATEHEILIGVTSRPESSSKPGRDAEYIVKAEGKKLVIRSWYDSHSYDLLAAFVNDYMTTLPIFNFPSDMNESKIRYCGEDRKELTDAADIRIISFNILCETWAENPDMSGRTPGVMGCILEYQPDVIGIQEVSQKWYDKLYTYIGDDYVFINQDILGQKGYNYTALAYNKNKVKLIESDIYYYSVGNSQRIRLLNMGYFEHLETGERFIVTNTHYNANHQSPEIDNVNRVIQATEFVQKINEYYAKYSCPIISTGDYNSNENSDPYKKMMEGGNIFSSKHKAAEKGNILVTTHQVGSVPPAGERSIDHILYTGEITPLYFSVLSDEYLHRASDHSPIMCDFKFN